MDFSSLPLFNLMKAKLQYSSERQAILAQNIANADTPSYRAKDIKEPDFKRMLAEQSGQQMTMSMTHPGHVSHTGGGTQYRVEERASTYEQSPVGNNVVTQEEMMRVAQNQVEYQKVLQMYRKTISMFKTALGGSNNG